MAIIDSKGRIVKKGDPEYDKVRIANLEGEVRELHRALVDVQHRLSRIDGEALQWPGDTYEPTHTEPAD